jgi:ABC-type glycerol-3-phosphate transport system substrate-binding protein
MKSFQTILLIIFAFFVVIAVLIFSGAFGGNANNKAASSAEVSMWGTVPAEVISSIVLQALNAGEELNIKYVQKNESNIESDLVNALASGVGPDLVLAPHTLILKQRDKFLPIPFTTITERQFKDTFAQASEIFLGEDYVLGMPVFANPLVMYWNRDIFNSAGVPSAPANWSAVQLLPAKMTKIDERGKISASAVALGGVSNVTHYKEILSAQIMQTGNKIVAGQLVTDNKGVLELQRTLVLGQGDGASSALRYFTEFGNPSLPKYSWNSAKNTSLDEFIAGNLGLYFGLASEEQSIRERNPHLNFDIANIPQISGSNLKLTYADVYAISVLKSSKEVSSAFAVGYKLAFGNQAKIISDTIRLPPVRRDLLALVAPDSAQSLFYTASVMAQVWYDPDWIATRNIFADMIEDVMIGKQSPEGAVSSADTRIRALLR